MKPKAIIYCRVSSDEQAAKNNSIPNQEQDCLAWCERQGFEVAGVFKDEGFSAKTADRPAFMEAVEFARRTKVAAFVVWKIDRFSRNQADFHTLRVLLSKFGVRLFSVTELIENNPTGTLLTGILAAFAQHENDARAERTVGGMKTCIQRGEWLWKAPIGYISAKREEDKRPRMVIDEERATLVRLAFELYSTGLYTKKEVLRRLNEQGLRTRKDVRLSIQTLERILSNPIYAGWINNTPIVGLERIRGNWEPLVSQSLFDMVQLVLKGRAYNSPPIHSKARPDFPLRGFILCAACGHPLTSGWCTGKMKKYPYYTCYKCRAVKSRKETLEAAFSNLLSQLCPDERYMTLFREVVLDVWKEKHAVNAATKVVTEGRLKKLKNQKKKLLDLLLDGTIDELTYKRKLDDIQMDETATKMEYNEEKIEALDIQAVLEFSELLIRDANKMWFSATAEQQQRLLKLWFQSPIKWDGKQFEHQSTSCIFKWLTAVSDDKLHLVAPTGFEPVFEP